ncbi:MAG: PVC-type heme-binding CxxCH protein [Prosthecobacter sp.]
MRRVLFLLLGLPLAAADLPADKSTEIPASGKRPVVVTGKAALPLPKHDLPPGYMLEVAAAAPLVTHPIMGCLDDKGRLYVGDAVGVNWNKKQLEASPPNRVLMLEDTDLDGAFDKSTVFADKMTFPQGACWLNGSLYVCSPPGLWKLTDTNNDGIADEREMIVGGFEYTGNAADVHGPFLHPNGRLYWCHGRKGHKVTQKDGTLVDESMACGIWSCRPDGSDVAWHSLGCGDNPVEVDFTREGDIIGVQNLYHSQPRGDTIVHWLYGGVYERADQLKAIAHLPRTLETMPVMYNFGHVAVSGCAFWHAWPSVKDAQQFMVTHFNTQRLVRMELTPVGSTYKAVENEFLKLHSPDIHLTDVMEDPRDGSLLLLDTGGWFRIGCPASLMAKSDLLGAVYRIKSTQTQSPSLAVKRASKARWELKDEAEVAAQLASVESGAVRVALEWVAENGRLGGGLNNAMVKLLDKPLDEAAEHQLIFALLNVPSPFMSIAGTDLIARRMLLVGASRSPESRAFANTVEHLLQRFDPVKSPALGPAMRRALGVIPDGGRIASLAFDSWLKEGTISAAKLGFMSQVIAEKVAVEGVQKNISDMLSHAEAAVRTAALNILASQTLGSTNESWFPQLDKLLADSPTPLVFDAIKKLKSPRFDAALQAIANDTKRPLAIRLKALDSAKAVKLTGDAFAMVKGVLADAASSSAAKIQAAGMIAAPPLQKPQVLELASLFAIVGPVELKALLPIVRKHKDADTGRVLAGEIAKNPVIASQQESAYRTAFSDLPPEIFESIVLPAYNAAVAATEAKKRQLSPLAEKVAAIGSADAGEKHFKAGKGTCVACHKVGDVGRPIGPDLSHIGAIRTERDLLESILFPSNTLARDYEAHVIETSDGQQILGVIKSHAAEGLVVLDIAGQEKTIPHQTIIGDTTLTTSLMPMGLDQTMPESELLDLVAWLRSLK